MHALLVHAHPEPTSFNTALTNAAIETIVSAGGTYGEIETVLRPVQRLVLRYMGFHMHEPFVCYAAPRVDDAARAAYLQQWQHRVGQAAVAAAAPRAAVAMPDMTRDWKSQG